MSDLKNKPISGKPIGLDIQGNEEGPSNPRLKYAFVSYMFKVGMFLMPSSFVAREFDPIEWYSDMVKCENRVDERVLMGWQEITKTEYEKLRKAMDRGIGL